MNTSAKKKQLQRRRMMRYFIEATYSIIQQEGIEMVTVRRISNLAGYNSATLYNYFDNLNNLIAFSSLKYLKDYALDLPHYIQDCPDNFEKYLQIWQCFCKHSFQNPAVYHKIFFQELGSSVQQSIREYYDIFPEELDIEEGHDLESMLIGETIQERTEFSLRPLVKDRMIDPRDVYRIGEGCILIYEGMLDKIKSRIWTQSDEAAVETVMHHLRRLMASYRIR